VLRLDGRANDELRPVRITPGYLSYAEGSALIELGQTRVLCAVSVEERIPAFLKGKDSGWVTAEYDMLPRATVTRTARERGGRDFEIQRLIGRSLRAVTDLGVLSELTLIVDCDVLQADGGTRTAAITAGYVALAQALKTINLNALKSAVAAVSVGIVDGVQLLDLCYDEDSRAEVDFNVVMTDREEFVEVQGTAEAKPFPKQTIDSLLALAEKGIQELFQTQKAAIEGL
jgi:ribonuclease PH